MSPVDEVFVSRGDIRGGVPPALVSSPVFVIRVFPDRQDNGSRSTERQKITPGQNIFVSARGARGPSGHHSYGSVTLDLCGVTH